VSSSGRASLPAVLAESVRERSDYLDDEQSCCGRDTSSGRMEDWMNRRVEESDSGVEQEGNNVSPR